MKMNEYIKIAYNSDVTKGVLGIVATNLVNISLTDIELAVKIIINIAMGIGTIITMFRKKIKKGGENV